MTVPSRLAFRAEQTQRSATRRRKWGLSVLLACGHCSLAWLLLVATALLYLWNLSASGWANTFYSAAAQAGADNWTAMLFGSSDAANAITVDKTPASLWIIDLSVRLFGLNPWSVLVPQALEGVAAVGPALCGGPTRRRAGCRTARRSGDRGDARRRVDLPLQQSRRPVGAAARRRRLLRPAGMRKGFQPMVVGAAGVAVGFGFLAKMLQAFLVLPGFGAAYLVAGHRPLARRLARPAASPRRPLVVSGGVVPGARRPLADRPGPTSAVHSTTASSNWHWATTVSAGSPAMNPAASATSTSTSAGAGCSARRWVLDIAWLLPAAVICVVAGLDHHAACTPHRSAAGRAHRLGRLAHHHRGGVQLHERHRAPVLHGGARTCCRRVHRHRCNSAVAEPVLPSAPPLRWPAPYSSPASWPWCC